MITTKAKFGHLQFDMQIFVVDSNTDNLLSRSTVQSLNLIYRNVDNLKMNMAQLDSNPIVDLSYSLKWVHDISPFLHLP